MRPHIVSRATPLWLALALFVLTTAAPASAQAPAAEIISHVKHAVVVITTYDVRGRPLLQGSGFFVAANRVITSLHVVKQASRAQIKTFTGQHYSVQGLVAANEQRDLALLEISAAPTQCTTLRVEETRPAEGEEIIVVSNPQGSSWQVSRGVAAAVWDFQDVGELLRITAAIAPGSSGGPVVNRRGRVVGVVAMHTSSADDLNFAVPGELVSTLRPGALKPLPGNAAQVARKY